MFGVETKDTDALSDRVFTAQLRTAVMDDMGRLSESHQHTDI